MGRRVPLELLQLSHLKKTRKQLLTLATLQSLNTFTLSVLEQRKPTRFLPAYHLSQPGGTQWRKRVTSTKGHLCV